MNITTKLRLIQEGFSFDQINENFIGDDLAVITENIISDINFASNLNIMNESSIFEKEGAIRRFINWIIEKLKQFRNFIISFFRRKRDENLKIQEEHIKIVEKLDPSSNNYFKPYIVPNTLEKIINSPTEAMKIFDSTLNACRREYEKILHDSDKGFVYNEIPQNSTEVDLGIIVWKRIITVPGIHYGQNITRDIITHILGGPTNVVISTKEQLSNIFDFSKNFYDFIYLLYNLINQYESTLKKVHIPENPDDTIRIIILTSSALIKTFKDCITPVHKHINILTDAMHTNVSNIRQG